jgi:hypothetical protein
MDASKKSRVTFADMKNDKNNGKDLNTTFEIDQTTLSMTPKRSGTPKPAPFSEDSFSSIEVNLTASPSDLSREMTQDLRSISSPTKAAARATAIDRLSTIQDVYSNRSRDSLSSHNGSLASGDPSFSTPTQTSTPVMPAINMLELKRPPHLTSLQWIHSTTRVWPSMTAAEVDALGDDEWVEYFHQHCDEFPKTYYTYPDCVWYNQETGKKWFVKPNMSNYAATSDGPLKPLRKFCAYTHKRLMRGVCCDAHDADEEDEVPFSDQLGFRPRRSPPIETARASSRISHRPVPSPMVHGFLSTSPVCATSSGSSKLHSQTYQSSPRPLPPIESQVVDGKSASLYKYLALIIIGVVIAYAMQSFRKPECYIA